MNQQSDFGAMILAYSRGGLGQTCGTIAGQCDPTKFGTGTKNTRGQCVYCGACTDYPNVVNDPSKPTAGATCPPGQSVVTNVNGLCWGCKAANAGAPGAAAPGAGGGSCGGAYPYQAAPNGATLCPQGGDPVGNKQADKNPANPTCYRCIAGGIGACPGAYFSKGYWQQFGGANTCDVPVRVNPTNANCYICPTGNINVPPPSPGGGAPPAGGGGGAPPAGGAPRMPNVGTPPGPRSPFGPGTVAPPAPQCPPPFQWQMRCDAAHPISILTENACNYCVADNNLPCAPGYQKPPRGWIFGGCPSGYTLDINEQTGCVACAITRCPYPYVSGPQVCQSGWQSVHHPQYPNCSVCAPSNGTTPAPLAPSSGGPASPMLPTIAPGATAPTPMAASVSTGAKVGIGVAVLAIAGLIFAGNRRK